MIQNLNELKKCENVFVRKVKDKYYIWGRGKCFELNETGVLVVKYIGKDMLIDEFCEKLGKKYNRENGLEQIKQDVISFVAFLLENKVIEGRR